MALGYHAIGQSTYEVKYDYDLAGNRTMIIVKVIQLVSQAENDDNSLFSDDLNTEEQFINETNGISDNVADQQFTIYPNPTKGMVYYRSTVPENAEGAVIVADANGRIIENTQLKTNGTLDFSKYANGIYFVRVTLNGDTSYWKIIKE
jgi:hypothetical protein